MIFLVCRTLPVPVFVSLYTSISEVLIALENILSYETAAITIHALITSRIVNGFCLLYWHHWFFLRKLHLAHNATARVLTKTEKFDHITHIERPSPIRARIKFKLLILKKSLHGTAPLYLSNVLVPYNPVCTLTNVYWYSMNLVCIGRSSFLSHHTNPLELVACEYQMLFITSATLELVKSILIQPSLYLILFHMIIFIFCIVHCFCFLVFMSVP